MTNDSGDSTFPGACQRVGAIQIPAFTRELRYTHHQVPRGSRPDAETIDKIYLIKNVSMLRATYQVRLLVFKAVESRKRLILKVPQSCQFHSSLKKLIKTTGNTQRPSIRLL